MILKPRYLNPDCVSIQSLLKEELHHERENSQFYSWDRDPLKLKTGPLKNASSTGQQLTELPAVSVLSNGDRKCHWTVRS